MNVPFLNLDVFSTGWFLLFASSFLVAAILAQWLHQKPEKLRRNVMVIITIGAFLYWIAYKCWLSQDSEFDFIIWNELPLQICNTVSIIAIIASLTGSRFLQGYCFHIGSIGALMSVLMPPADFSAVPFWSPRGIGYYGYHFMLLMICLSFVMMGLYRPKYKDALYNIVSFFALGTVIHHVNLLFRATVYPEANYFYSFGMEGNPILEGLLKIIPIPLLYSIPLMILIWAVGLGMMWVVRRLVKEKEPVPEPETVTAK